MGRVFWGIDYLSAEGAVCGGKWDAAHQEHENETHHPPRLHLHSDAKLPRGVSLFSESGTHIVVPQKAHLNLAKSGQGWGSDTSFVYGQGRFNQLRHGVL
jgi:hypothetical protein